MDLRSIYVANGVGIFIILILYYTSVKKMLKHDLEDRIFTFMMFGVMGCSLCFMGCPWPGCPLPWDLPVFI